MLDLRTPEKIWALFSIPYNEQIRLQDTQEISEFFQIFKLAKESLFGNLLNSLLDLFEANYEKNLGLKHSFQEWKGQAQPGL